MNHRSVQAVWIASGAALVIVMAALSRLSTRFPYDGDMADFPIPLLVVLLMSASLPYFAAVCLARYQPQLRHLLIWIFGCGLVMRLLLLPSQPILEDDFYRYLWDGGMVANGHNPYQYAPEDILGGAGAVPGPLASLARDAGPVFDRINHPWLSTIYPPVAQIVFAAAHLMQPWKLGVLKTLFLLSDLAAFYLLIRCLRCCALPASWVVIYWWNPLLLKEIFNSGHMDALLMPLLAGMMLAMLHRNALAGGSLLALAAGAKIWPVLLAPLAALACGRKAGLRIGFLLLSGAAGALLLAPLVVARVQGGTSGLAAYGTGWEMNDALFMVFPWTLKQGAALAGLTLAPGSAHRAGRIFAALLVAAVVLWQWRAWRIQVHSDNDQIRFIPRSALIITAALFLLSPTQFPWYFSWLVPFLVLRPSWGILLLTTMLPLYYLRFYYDARGIVELFHYRVVWIEFAPVWLVLALEAGLQWKQAENDGAQAHVPDGHNTTSESGKQH